MDKMSKSPRIRLGYPGSSIAILLFILIGLQTKAQAPVVNNPVHLPTDWSHRHLVFSQPANYAQAWELQKEPRYFHQYVRQHMPSVASISALPGIEEAEASDIDEVEARNIDSDARHLRRRPLPQRRRKDWAVSLGANLFMGAGQFPAKFTFDVNAVPSCTSDYVAFTTSVNGTLQIVGFDNLYSSQVAPAGLCGAAGPAVKWAYNTRIVGDVTGTTLTSPVLSFDGTKIAYIESRTNANGGSILQILKWKPGAGTAVQGTIAAPATPDTTMAAGQAWNTTNCPAINSCVVSIILNGKQPVTMSSPFYNYAFDILYVGDDNGVLHKFTGVFLGTPMEVTSGGWPLTVHTGAVLTAPVYDFVSQNIFVADSLGQLSFVKEAGSVTGACGAGVPPCLGSVHPALTGSIVDPPILDSSTKRLLVFDGTETSGNNGSVFQFDTALTNASKVTVKIGGGNGPARPTDILHAGTFDDNYFSLGPASGHLYTCGKDPAVFFNRPAIYQLSFDAAGVLQTTGIPAPLVNLTSTFSLIGDACSPVTEIKIGATDRIFFSFAVNANPPAGGGTATGCTAGEGCVVMIQLGGAWPPLATNAGIAAPFIGNRVAQTGAGGASGIVVDNISGSAQASSVYYTYRVNSEATTTCRGTSGVGCAVKATQSALQ